MVRADPEELNKNIVAFHSFITTSKMSKQLLGLRIGRLMPKQRVGRFAFPIRSPGKHKYFYGVVVGTQGIADT